MHKLFDPPISPEALQRMSFEEKYEGFCVDMVKVELIYSLNFPVRNFLCTHLHFI